MAQGLPWDPFIQSVVTQLIGKDRFTQRDCVRGIYCTLPQGNAERQGRHMHIDDGRSTLGVVCYVDRVEPDGGGFTVWPRSHRRLFSRHTRDTAGNTMTTPSTRSASIATTIGKRPPFRPMANPATSSSGTIGWPFMHTHKLFWGYPFNRTHHYIVSLSTWCTVRLNGYPQALFISDSPLAENRTPFCGTASPLAPTHTHKPFFSGQNRTPFLRWEMQLAFTPTHTLFLHSLIWSDRTPLFVGGRCTQSSP